MVKLTQKEEVLNHLNKYNSITPLEAVNLYLIMDLAGIIRDIKKLGYPIYSEWKTSENGKHYKRYYLNDTQNTPN